MDTELKEDVLTMTSTPTLEFGEAPKPKEVPAPAPEVTSAAPASEMDDSMLSQEEKQLVDSFVEKIDLHNTQGILEYGAGTQKKMADFSQSTLENVRGKDMGEIGDLLASVVTEVKSFDATEEDSNKGFFGLFKKTSNKITALKVKYDKAEVSVNNISNALEGHQIVLLKDVAMLDKMYDMNLSYYKELTMYILAGKKKLEKTRNHELVEMRTKAQTSGLAEDAQAARDLDELCNRFEKKLHDLDLTRTIAMQTAPQIRLIQNNDTQMAEKIQSTIVNTIPLWKNQMVIALGVNHSLQAAQAQREVTDATNELLKKNSEMLKTATIETARENERGVVDMETLKTTNANLISTLDEVMKIQQEGRQARAQAETELRTMENELKNKLLTSSAALN
ncbi:MAG: toxic anion resistance protein [Lachnospiraceae bacterium]|nr:toxic anion resistance protein [Lachnospiraceae bacterium]